MAGPLLRRLGMAASSPFPVCTVAYGISTDTQFTYPPGAHQGVRREERKDHHE